MKILSAVLIVVATAGLTLYQGVRGRYRLATNNICDLVETHYYRSREESVVAWLRYCRARAAAQPDFLSRNEVITEVNSVLASLGVSHLVLYTPDENRAIWDNEAVDTGLRARIVDGFVIVHEVIAGSAGARAGFKEGDVIIGIDGQEVGAAEEVEGTSGEYFVSRFGDELRIQIKAEPLAVNLGPALVHVDKTTVILRLRSFLGRYFERAEWTRLAEQLPQFRHVIIDLRENAGGSFPAMVRAMSPFFCEATRIGTIYQPKNDTRAREDMLRDELDTDSQLEQLEGVTRLHLTTFPGYPCYSGRVTVLVDHGTSSVAEIFADGFLSRPKSRVWGMPTSGQVVMAQWFPVPGFGAGDFSLSIPIAGFADRAGVALEDEGVIPERLLYYDLERASEGRDSWVEDAALSAWSASDQHRSALGRHDPIAGPLHSHISDTMSQ